jgi:nucleotide-binding universal stress UspA family protein
MIERILVAVDDSAPALAAGAFAIELARSLAAELHVVTVAEAGRDPDVILRHIGAAASAAGLSPTITAVSDGTHPFEALLAAAVAWRADLVVMGRSDTRRTGRPYVGSQTEHLLEFTEVPVVVVPEAATGRR